MDRFEAEVLKIMEKSGKDKEKSISSLKQQCVCPKCPTYTDCSKNADEGLYCVLGESKECIDNDRGCICPECSLAQAMGVGTIFNTYCIKGSEMEERKRLHDLDRITGGE
ncbi:MAG: hypothetical protein Kow0019_18570 [Methanobacteriaceae archaeon]